MRALPAGKKSFIAAVHIADKKTRRIGIRTGDQDHRHAHHVGGQARGNQLLYKLADRHHHLAAQVAALLGGRKLIFEMNRRSAGLDHRLHQLICIQNSPIAGFSVGDNRRQPIRTGDAVQAGDLS